MASNPGSIYAQKAPETFPSSFEEVQHFSCTLLYIPEYLPIVNFLWVSQC